jgi:hypothetical protein
MASRFSPASNVGGDGAQRTKLALSPKWRPPAWTTIAQSIALTTKFNVRGRASRASPQMGVAEKRHVSHACFIVLQFVEGEMPCQRRSQS